MIISCDRLYTREKVLENQVVSIENGLVSQIADNENAVQVDAHHCHLSAGFIDIQVNGGGGILFNQETNAEAVDGLFAAHQQFGTTGMLPTIITDSAEVMAQAADAVMHARASGNSGILGVHFEGPWLSKERKGVHPEDHIRLPSQQELSLLRKQGLGKVLLTLAPESVPPEVIRELVEDDIIVFLGHSAATATQVNDAIDAGAIGFTHLFNAMSPLQSRAPGMVGSALNSAHCFAGIIVDGYHVDPMCCELAVKCMGKERVALVTDAMALAASDKTSMPFFDTTINKDGEKLTTPDGTLAGSCLTMDQAVSNLVTQTGISLHDALVMASATPASILHLGQEMGDIKTGMTANLVALHEDLTVQQVYQNGHAVK